MNKYPLVTDYCLIGHVLRSYYVFSNKICVYLQREFRIGKRCAPELVHHFTVRLWLIKQRATRTRPRVWIQSILIRPYVKAHTLGRMKERACARVWIVYSHTLRSAPTCCSVEPLCCFAQVNVCCTVFLLLLFLFGLIGTVWWSGTIFVYYQCNSVSIH